MIIENKVMNFTRHVEGVRTSERSPPRGEGVGSGRGDGGGCAFSPDDGGEVEADTDGISAAEEDMEVRSMPCEELG